MRTALQKRVILKKRKVMCMMRQTVKKSMILKRRKVMHVTEDEVDSEEEYGTGMQSCGRGAGRRLRSGAWVGLG